MKIKIGTRKSLLALAQTNMVANALKNKYPKIEIEIVHITTKGDKILNQPLEKIGGKGVFVTEIEKALINGSIDIAVHSGKDLPMELGENLAVLGVLPRGDYRDVLVTAKGTKVKNQSDFVVGTGSLRRRTNFKKLYNKVSFADIRGNVDTRLRKLLNGEYDGVILAMAGLERLNKLKESDFDFMPFEYNEFLPAPCQGIIAVEGRVDDFTTELINSINDESTFIAFETEREVLKLLNADCGMPVGAYSYLTKGNIVLSVSKTSEKSICSSDSISNRMELAKRLVEKL